jgi:phosphatidylserine/phosphatidylglycerophosphate/cardiolipin synthase-like enzyme
VLLALLSVVSPPAFVDSSTSSGLLISDRAAGRRLAYLYSEASEGGPTLNRSRFSSTRILIFAACSFSFLAIPSRAFSSHAQHPELIGSVNCLTEVRYSPHGGALEAVLSVLAVAQQSVIAAMYSLTHSDIVDALVAARWRGVEVAIKLDRLQSAGQSQGAAIARLQEAGVVVEVSDQSRQLHDKFAVIDGRWITSGSFNWTANAENRNRENLLVMDCPELAWSFISEWALILPGEP